jgi:hypothetical protein
MEACFFPGRAATGQGGHPLFRPPPLSDRCRKDFWIFSGRTGTALFPASAYDLTTSFVNVHHRACPRDIAFYAWSWLS